LVSADNGGLDGILCTENYFPIAQLLWLLTMNQRWHNSHRVIPAIHITQIHHQLFPLSQSTGFQPTAWPNPLQLRQNSNTTCPTPETTHSTQTLSSPFLYKHDCT